MTYAAGTSVSVEKTRAEIDRLLSRHGASARAMGADDLGGFAYVMFALAPKGAPAEQARRVRVRVPMPKRGDKRFTQDKRASWRSAPTHVAERAWEQACRERWRGLLLILKAKLEAIEIGVSTVDREFLADTFLPSGKTVYEELGAQIEASYLNGDMPPLLGAGT